MAAVDLSDLLTAAGNAMGISNARLAAEGAPALLSQFNLMLAFTASFEIPAGDVTLILNTAPPPSPQAQVLFHEAGSNVTVNVTYIAAPSLVPVAPT